MINFFSETSFDLISKSKDWESVLNETVRSESFTAGDINIIFCDDEYLHGINVKFLGHDDYTDIITFDNTKGNLIEADIFISIERVKENALSQLVDFETELHRVMVHGLLHCMNYDDKKKEERSEMRRKEEEKMKLFHVEH